MTTIISLGDNHQFSCDPQFANTGAINADLLYEKLNFDVIFLDMDDREYQPTGKDIVKNEHGNAMKVMANYFEPDRRYIFRCAVNYEKDGVTYNGRVYKSYSTASWIYDVGFSVMPG